jgi:hypothetical protein
VFHVDLLLPRMADRAAESGEKRRAEAWFRLIWRRDDGKNP